MKDEVRQWLAEQAEMIDCPRFEGSKIWVTKARGDYITLEGIDKDLSHLVGLTYVSSTWEPGKPINIGFNPTEQKWYGWSHRAMYGFGVGSDCKKGDCHYIPVDKKDFLDDCIRFWHDDDHNYTIGEHRDDGVYIEWEYSDTVPNESIRGQISGHFIKYPDQWGKGEWVAKSMADARQMAIDFAESAA